MEFILEYKTATAAQKVGDQVKVSAAVAEIGRDTSCQVVIDESCATVSRKHAKIELDGVRYKITALSQTNSTYVNGVPVKGERYLNNGDEIKLSSQGPTVIFKVDDPRATRAVDAAATVATATQQNVQRPTTPAPAPAKKSNMPLIIGIVAALIIAGCAAFFFLNSKEPVEDEVVVVPEAKIEDCFSSIYFVKIDDVCLYQNGTLVSTLKPIEVDACGTGFMLTNGKFVTAASVIMPWIFEEGGLVGSDSKKTWTYEETKVAGYNIVTNLTAYTNAGTSFKFSSSDCVTDLNTGDWATLAKADQLSTVGGLDMDAEWSVAPQYGTECQIAGYLPNANLQSLMPSAFKNAVNVTELNKDNMIELSSQRWTKGLSGSPVVIDENGKYIVIGIMTNSNIADRDVVVPIANAVK